MQESFSITEKWDRASSKTAVMWAISHVITNIPECVKSMEKATKVEGIRERNNAISTNGFLYLFFIEFWDWISCMKKSSQPTLGEKKKKTVRDAVWPVVDFLLYGPCSQKSVDRHLLFLTDPPCPLPCLWTTHNKIND